MKIKAGANLQGLDIRVRPILVEAEKIWLSLGQELVVTCGLDGTHSAGSLHYYGLAVDLRINYFTDEEKEIVAHALRNALKKIDKRFDVYLHSTHIHGEYDVIKKI